jgi:hypothetical protein
MGLQNKAVSKRYQLPFRFLYALPKLVIADPGFDLGLLLGLLNLWAWRTNAYSGNIKPNSSGILERADPRKDMSVLSTPFPAVPRTEAECEIEMM